jgi:hypothetical protein
VRFSEKTLQTVFDILEAYGVLLEKHPLAICDVSMLPLSKLQMKMLFKAMCSRAKSPEQEQVLENSFWLLSNFQEGVGPNPLDESITKDASAEDKVTILDQWLSWENIAAAELQELMAEWKRFKAGEPL